MGESVPGLFRDKVIIFLILDFFLLKATQTMHLKDLPMSFLSQCHNQDTLHNAGK